MAQQEGGWPLGLRPVNARVGLARNPDFNGSISFTTLITSSSTNSSTDSSSDLDSQSTGSFFHDNSITLGSLIRVSSIFDLSRRSTRRIPVSYRDQRNNCKSKPWCFSLCSRLSTDAVNTNNDNFNVPSLGHYLEAERRAGHIHRRIGYGPNDHSPPVMLNTNLNTLFVDGEIAPRSIGSLMGENDQDNNGSPLSFSCLCGHLTE